MRRLLILFVGLGLFLVGNGAGGCPAGRLLDNCFSVHAQAQAQGEVDLYPADASSFPTISALMDVLDISGRFVSGLKPEQVKVVEDGQPVPLTTLNEMTVPLQLAVAINPGPSFGVRNKQGTAYFQGVENALRVWAKALPADTPDDMSLVSITGPIIAHASAKDWLVSLGGYQPDFRATTPNLQALQVALETVAIQAPRAGMKRAVLFITPHMDDANVDTLLQPLIQRAVQNRIRVFVWFTDTDLYTATASATAFTALAAQTGGAYFSAAGLQPYPDPESYFSPLRRVYSLTYRSGIRTGGAHKVSVEVQGQAGVIRSGEQDVNVNLQPPNPILVSPPLQIVRSPPAEDPYNDKVLLPADQHISIIVEFPDGHKRALMRTTLYVDGKPVGENKTPPFDSFTWDLSGYGVSGEHKIAVEAVDALSLSKTSMEIPVTITVNQPPHGMAALFGRYQRYITVGSVALAGLVLLVIILAARFRTIFAAARSARGMPGDPLTQAVSAGVHEPTAATEKTTKRRRELTTKRSARAVEAAAFLRRLQADPLAAPGETFKPAPGAPIPLGAREITFGTDPAQSSYVLDDPSLGPRHARITRTEGGDYFVVDAGTIGGTWVNFEPVGQEAHLLRHGDVLHFGQLVFRFELKEPPAPVAPTIARQNPEA
jgi:hypothetical protein